MTLSRREFLRHATAAAVAAPLTMVASGSTHAGTTSENLFDILSGFHFRDESGAPIHIEALRHSLKNKFVTVSFGFGQCSSICSLYINPALKKIGDENPRNIVSIAINAAPESEVLDASMYRDFKNSIVTSQDVKQEVITLFPTRGKNGPLSNEAAEHAQKAFSQIIKNDVPEQHSGYILLFAPGGEKVGEKHSRDLMDGLPREWGDILRPPAIGR